MAQKMKYVKTKKEEELEQKVSFQQIFDNFIVPQIPSYYSVYSVDFEGKPVACCPLHDEDTPSFRVYDETNTFHCFGCGKTGNVVSLYQLFFNRFFDANVSRKQVIDFLYQHFLEGKDVKPLATGTVKEEKINNPVDEIRLNTCRLGIEERITFEKTISQSDKERIWELLDNVDVLISLNKLKANEAIPYIREEVKNIIGDSALITG